MPSSHVCTLPLAVLLTLVCVTVCAGQPVPGWPNEVQAITYPSAADNTPQPALFYNPGGEQPVPLLVALHTWGGDYTQAEYESDYAAWCIKKGWVLIHPNFRGSNSKPSACGSELVVQDLLSAVAYAQKNAHIDPARIYLVGFSGGGYAALLMAGRAPDVWAAVSAWCPVYDLAAWHGESKARKNHYAEHLEKVCGGEPGHSPAVDEQYRKRSASTYLAQARKLPLDINAGVSDGLVPASQSLHAFNALVAATERIPDEDIAAIMEKPGVPERLRQKKDDPLARGLFCKMSGQTRVTLFAGAHMLLADKALTWLEQQRQGAPAVWNVPAEPKTSKPGAKQE